MRSQTGGSGKAVPVDGDQLVRSEQRLELLSEAYGLLLSSNEPEAVIQAIADRVLSHLGADVFFNYVLDPGAERLRLNAWGGVPQRVAKMIERLEIGQAICGCVARDGERIISEDVQHNGDPRADLVRRMGVRCYCCHPLKSGEATVGTLSFGTRRKDCFDADEIELMRTVASQVSIALDRKRSQDDLQHAVQEQKALVTELGRRADREQLLRELAEIGSSSRTGSEAASRFMTTIIERMNCTAGGIFALGGDGSDFVPLATGGVSHSFIRGLAGRLDTLGPLAGAEALRRRRAFYVADCDDDETLPEAARATFHQIGIRAAFSAPLIVRDEALGAITLGWAEPRVIDEVRFAFLESIAAEVAAGIASGRLFEAERESARLGAALIEVQSALASSLDVDGAMPRVLEQLRLELNGIGGTVVERIAKAWQMRAAEGSTATVLKPGMIIHENRAPALTRVLATSKPVVVEDTTASKIFNAALTRKSGIRAFATYPLLVRGEITGALTIQFGEPRTFTDGELEFMRRAAYAISLSEENSRLYKAEQTVADRLQEALLALPAAVRGLDFAAAYHSAAEMTRVGGDFYDLFELDADRVGIVIGDVAGHGINAAMLTSMVKHTVRAHAFEAGKGPARSLELTNDVVYNATATDTFVTVLFGILDRKSGRFVYANAGHPAGDLVASDGTLSRLPVTGPLLGAFANVHYDELEATVGHGDLLFLYTDGLTEAREGSELFGERRVAELLEVTAGGSPTDVVQAIVGAAMAFSGNTLRDDLAVLAMRRVEFAE